MRILCFQLGLVLALSIACEAAQPADRWALAIERVGAALDTVTATKRPGRVGYATIHDGDKYVQCRRAADGAMRCEAAGIAMQPALAAVLTPKRRDALAALGWSRDAAFGNFVRLFPAATPATEVAAQIVRMLAEAYGSDPADLERATAFVEDVPCPPRNAPGQPLAGVVNDGPAMRQIRACSQAEAAVADRVDSAAALVTRSGATVAAEIARLRANASRHVFAIFDGGTGYVQCGPESPQALYCEAQSPQGSAALATILTPDRLARLHALGYADPGRATNYWKRYRFERFSDAAVAAEVLTILHDVYGYDGAAPLDIKTE